MSLKKGKRYLILFSVLLFLLLPQTIAYARTGISPLDQGIETISRIFNIQALQNEYVQIGFLKLMIFIVLFSVINLVFKKHVPIFKGDKNGSKTAGIVSFAFSAIGTFMMPHEWLLATGGLITAILSSAIFIGVFVGLSYLAFKVLTGSLVMNLCGLVILFILLFIVTEWSLMVGLPLILIFNEDWIKKKLRYD